ncbi:kinase-like domain-containing protein [Ephemerocybe angulata]|uniref:non-specific serine/threonine protein kinase n=1 Tax=Ephemerocybe angulata TaxID=980116 RepID=A0A8H6HPV8_9AGAR|nr:kinase-like domain-containing protein [Tulosesus angulatus]
MLGDFGVSKALAQANPANTYIGTPYYMSRKLMQEKAYDYKSDIWSLGCLIYELCALKPPFHEAKTHSELSILIRWVSLRSSSLLLLSSSLVRSLASPFALRPSLFTLCSSLFTPCFLTLHLIHRRHLIPTPSFLFHLWSSPLPLFSFVLGSTSCFAVLISFGYRNGRIPPLPRGYSQSLFGVIKAMLNLNLKAVKNTIVHRERDGARSSRQNTHTCCTVPWC